MRSGLDGPRILSQPFRVRWLGWESDTVSMQRMGWQLAVDFEPSRMAYRLMAKHEQGNLYGFVPDWVEIPPEAAYPGNSARMTATAMRLQQERGAPVFEFQCFANKINIHNCSISGMRANWMQIDAEPVMVMDEPISIEDLNVFRVRPHEEEIFVEEADMTVLDHLEAIKALQSDKQREIRQRMLNGKRTDEQSEIITHANIVSLRSVA